MEEEKIRNEFIYQLEDMPPEFSAKAIHAFERMLRRYELQKKETSLITQSGVSDIILDVYLKIERSKGRPAASVQNYEYALREFFRSLSKPINEICSIDIIQYLDDYKNQRNVSQCTLNMIRGILSSFFRWAAQVGYITKNPVDLVPKFKTQKKQREYLTDSELEELRDCCNTLKEQAIIEFMVSTACRIAEMSSIRLRNVNWNENTVVVTGKGNKQRRVTITPKCRIAIDAYLASRGYGKAKRTAGLNKAQRKLQKKLGKQNSYKVKETSNEPLFMGKKTAAHPDGEMTTKNLREAFENIVARTSFGNTKWVTPHTMRHTWATLARRKGMAIDDISEYLGHEQLSTTMIYVAVDKDRIRSDVLRFSV